MYHPQHLNLSNIISDVEFEGIANGRSLQYIELYNIPEAHSIIRGTIRYKVSI